MSVEQSLFFDENLSPISKCSHDCFDGVHFVQNQHSSVICLFVIQSKSSLRGYPSYSSL